MAPMDLSTALPPTPASMHDAVRTALATLGQRRDIGADLRLNRGRGFTGDRTVASVWLAPRLSTAPEPERIIITNGTQSALTLLFHALVPPGGLVAAERLTYVVLRQLVERTGRRLTGLAIDEEGIVPGAFEALCAQEPPAVLYCNPTIHNPTTAIASAERRRHLAAIARRHGVKIVEDDVLGALHPDAPPPIAAVAPDITWYCMSLSKCLAMGLRMAYLVAPDGEAADRLVTPVAKLSAWFPASLTSLLVEELVMSGSAGQISADITAEMAARQVLARNCLEGHAFVTKPGALHIWLPLARDVDRAGLVARLQTKGIAIRPSDIFLVEPGDAPHAVRVSLSAPADRHDLHQGLSILREELERHPCPAQP